MGKNTNTKRHETTLIQLLVLLAAVITPLLAFNLMDMELIIVSKSMLLTLWSSSINPWLYPPYIYLLINFIIFFIFASSFIHNHHNTTTTTFTNPTYDHNPSSVTDPFIESYDNDDDETKVDKMEDTLHGLKDDHVVVDKRELRKSRTFHEGGSRAIGRRERYVRVLSQEELDRRVEAFIYRFKKDRKL